jgi:nicotinamide-nucleotide amidase
VIAVSEDKIENILAEMLTERNLTISTKAVQEVNWPK